MLIDIHSHLINSSFVANNKYLKFVIGTHSMGLHPWELAIEDDIRSIKARFNILKQSINPRVITIGECGLDRRRTNIADLSLQEEVLDWHLDWATEVQKPIIIHCVKAYSDLLRILKFRNYKGKILIHDFSENIQIAEKFLNYDCYFSFGANLFKTKHHSSRLIRELPKEKMFLETDDQTIFDIEVIYDKAKDLLHMSSREIEDLFEQNLYAFFSNLNDISPANIVDNLSSSKNS